MNYRIFIFVFCILKIVRNYDLKIQFYEQYFVNLTRKFIKLLSPYLTKIELIRLKSAHRPVNGESILICDATFDKTNG